MALNIELKRSGVPGKVPTTSSLELGQIALNTYDGKAFMKKSGSLGEEIIEIGGGGGINAIYIADEGILQGTASYFNFTGSGVTATVTNNTASIYVPGNTGSQGIQGIQGIQGASGSQGVQGIQGLQGVQGVQGTQGVNGSSNSFFNYKAKTTSTSGDPLSGYLLWNNVTQSSATQINISEVDGLGDNIDVFFSNITSGSVVTIQDKTSHLNYQTWTVGTSTDNSTYWSFPAALVTSSYSFSNDQDVLFIIVTKPAGLQGVQGIQGIQGIQGASGSQGVQGTQGIQGIQGASGSQGVQGIQGASGSRGVQGIQGIQGASGSQGVQGIQGIQGASGSQGVQGILGIQGASGSQGVQGTQGIQGASGSQGIQGTSGSQGVQGIQGIQGASGSQGVQGILGIQGASGSQGVQGIQGIQGASGSQGIQGASGSQGVQGIQGASGSQGIQGIQGASGSQGVQGTQGIQGASGSQGIQGILGIQGASGSQGVQGTQGIQGASGSQGIQGIQGASGSQGIQGIQGASGSQGIQGASGSQGVQGILGIQGASGSQGVQGILGIQGASGSQGVQGILGIQGASGSQGVQGILGAQGASGSQGVQGILGIQGASGSQGVQGILGIQGASGSQGVQGISGIQGASGSQGIQGTQGTQGILGAQGASGSQGVQGILGAQGASGSQGIQGTQGTQGIQGAAVSVSGTTNYVTKFTSATTIGNTGAPIFDDGTDVGIGTTTPTQKLEVLGNALIGPTSGKMFIGDVGHGITYPALAHQDYATTTGYALLAPSDGYLFLNKRNVASTYIGFRRNNTDLMVLNNDGNLGIGVTNPGYKLDVRDVAQFGGDSGRPTIIGGSAGTNYIKASTGGWAFSWSAQGSSGTDRGGYGWYGGADSLTYYWIGPSFTSPHITILNGGNVGIGNTSPGSRLEVFSSTGAAAFGNGINIVTSPGTFTTGHGGILQFQNEDVITAGIRGVRDPGSWASSLLFYTHTSGVGNTFDTTFTEKMRINDGGNVGIGSTSPGYKLDVNGAARVNDSVYFGTEIHLAGNDIRLQTGAANSEIAFNFTGKSNATINVYNGAGGSKILLHPNGSSYFNGGSVGIGITSPQSPLHVIAASSADNALIQEWSYTAANADVYSLMLKQTVTSGVVRYNFSMVNNGTAYNDVLVLDRGNVGIGISSPTYKLDVYGTAQDTTRFWNNQTTFVSRFGSSNNTQFADIILDTNSGTGEIFKGGTGFGSYGGAGSLNIYNSNAGIYFFPNGTSTAVMTLVSGNVGIGTTSPTDKLTVDGNLFLIGSSRSVWIGNNADSGPRFRMHHNGTDAYLDYSSSLNIRNGVFSAVTTLASNGNVGIGSSNPAYKLDVAGTIRATADVIAYSDARVKENVTTVEKALEKVKALRGVTYTRKDTEDKSEKIGVIAQEVLKVLPQVVQQDDQGNYSVAYGNIVGILIEAIKEQQRQIDDLKYLLSQK